jgi:23S rRNA (cytidine2498-2'-O)-methyltransferase
MSNPSWHAHFLFATCQAGAENALKQDLARRLPQATPAFARPGFVTFKLREVCQSPERFEWSSPLARTGGFVLGKVTGETTDELARAVWTLPEVARFVDACAPNDLHVWQRDHTPPGEGDFEPGPTPQSQEATVALRAAAPNAGLRQPTSGGHRQGWVLDVALVDPGQWWVGCHRKTSRVSNWPGGVPDLELPDYAVSRAYLKMAEALSWASLPMRRGDVVLELGCAPGGASQALLDAGLVVVGVDPAEVDPVVLAHDRFTHVRRRTIELPKQSVAQAQWLCVDMNVTPRYSLDAVEAVVREKAAGIRGMLLTLKLPDWALLEEIPEHTERLRQLGYRDVRVRQLAFNRQEICVAVLRSRGQRRMLRTAPQRRRRDGPHARPRGPRGPTAGKG